MASGLDQTKVKDVQQKLRRLNDGKCDLHVALDIYVNDVTTSVQTRLQTGDLTVKQLDQICQNLDQALDLISRTCVQFSASDVDITDL